MAAVNSTMLPLGTPAPDFSLPDVVSKENVSLEHFTDANALLVMFICQHCPFVKHINSELAQLGIDYTDKGVAMVAISSNSIQTHPEDSPDMLKKQAEEYGFNFPYCYDKDQVVAKAYTAACTPDFFIFNADKNLAYRGQLDDSRPSNDIPVTGADIRAALDALINDKPLDQNQKPSIGCNIKWAPGNEPPYFN